MRERLRQTLLGCFCLTALLFGLPLHAGEVAKADLDILGLALEVDRNPVTTAVDIPAYVQTKFGGKSGDEAPPAPGMSAIGELTGPGIDTPITLITTPGRPFALPALHEKGEYALQNVRLVGASGEFLQQAVPSFAIINVSDVLKTEIRVRQLTPEELRERGIQIDSRNYEVFEYTVVFGVDGSQTVTIPYPVIVDKRTHEVVPVPRESPYYIPEIPKTQRPPRFEIPDVSPFELGPGGDDGGGTTPPDRDNAARPSIPAALVVPNGFGVLHQFFAVVLQVQNSAPDGSNIKLDAITATINAPTQLRVAKVMPAVSIGQPVPITDEKTGATYLVAAARGSAEWSLEALKAGTHTVDVEVRATYQKPGQADVPMRGRVSASLVVSDPRFQLTFSHPDTVRKNESYTAWTFVTNNSSQRQHVVLDSAQIPLCTSGASAENICRVEGDGTYALDLEPGQMKPVPYKLLSKITGKVFAAAGTTSDEALGASVKLTMGVSASGIPLSPATLVMPYYAQFLPSAFVDANMQLLGLAYGLATAPLNQYTAKFPRVIKQDVFTRAQQIARAGQRVFISPTEKREPFFHLALDLLGNSERVDQIDTAPELREWDELRRAEESGRRAEAAMARELEANGFSVDAFAAATSHRAPFLFAYAHGAAVSGVARPYALSVKALTSGGVVDVPAEAESGWIRTLPYSQLTKLDNGTDKGELALVGRWRDEDFRISVVPAASAFTLHLIYPDTANGTQLRTDIDITNATPGVAVEIDLRRGARTLIVKNATATPLVNVVSQTPLRVVGAAQDLHLDDAGHLVSLLFNRPINVTDAKTLRDRFALTVNVAKANYSVTRRNTPSDSNAQLQIPGAALQDDAKIINVTFDKTLSRNAAYLIGVDSIVDLVTSSTFAKSDIVPRIDNDRPGAILTGKVLRADNTPVANVLVNLLSNQVRQIDLSGTDGKYLFEFVPRDLDSGISGAYALSASDGAKTASLEGAVRLASEVHTVNLVFLGRGRAIGNVRYSDGEVVPNIEVTIGSTMFDQARHGITDAQGNYDIGDLPVGPLTFSVVDKDGRPTFAANQIRTAGEVVTQDLVIVKREPPGTGTVRITVRRSDTNAVITGALVGVWQQGYALRDGYTGTDGTFTFTDVPAGLVSMLAADFSLSRNGAGVEVELRRDQTIEQTLVIAVPVPNVQYATLEGTVLRDDPAAPNDTTKDQLVAGAIVTVSRVPAVTSNADGSYLVPDLPLDASGRVITVFDPATGRRGYFTMPTLVAGSNHFTLRLRSTQPAGLATARVRLYGPQNESVSGYRVIWPGFPPDEFAAKGSGVYDRADIRVPQTINVAAVPTSANGPYGEQVAFGSVRVDFHGQIGVSDLRLPGSGTVVVRLEMEGSSTQVIGPVSLTYGAWDEAEQSMMEKTIEGTPDPNSGLVTFTKVPARMEFSVATVRNPAGFASGNGQLAYDGDVRNLTLRLKTIGDVSGRVYAYDGVTPVSGATVRIFTRNATYAPAITNPDGTFRFAGIAAATDFTLIADLDRDGIYRTGIAGGRTPQGGGPVANLVIQLRQQSTVEGQVLDTNNAIVPLARFWLRELAWPYRSIGTPQEPLQADINGRFVVSNVFTGEFRITAVHPTNQEIRGDYQGYLAEEGDASQRNVQLRIGGAGVGAVSVTVTDPLLGFAPAANAEVALYRGSGRFDFATTNENGVVFFDSVPVGTYSVGAYSKTVGRGGGSGAFTVANQQTASVTVQLEFRGLVSGTLTDPESEPTPGLPVKGAPVYVYSQSSTQAASTDVLGAFEFLGVPEGAFSMAAFEIGTNRRAFGPTNLFISRLVPERKDIHLELERTGTLTVKTYLPNDAGGAGELAPITEVTVWQGNLNYGPILYYRGQQGNPVTFRKLLRGRDYGVEVRELGGEGRVVRSGGNFSTSNLTQEHAIVFPTTGAVEVRVVDAAGQPVADAKVDIFANFGTRTMYTPASGVVTLPGVPFGWITAQASKGNVTASGGGALQSRSQTLVIPLNLGTNASVEGGVDAELGFGQPSANTRVLMTVTTRLSSPLRLETLTDAAGNYRFTGIPVGGTTLTLTFYGPDDTTIGATRVVSVADGTTGVIAIPRVKIDATPPRVLSIDPPANATSVSPSTVVTVTFSEQIASEYLNRNWFSLLATDDGSFVQSSIEPSVRPDGTFIIKIVPPPPPAGQTFALKSNVLYRLAIPAGIRDTTGNAMPVAIGSSFTTVNYTEPAVVKIEPAENLPIPANTTFRIKFNKAIDINGGVVTLEQLDAYKGNAIATVPIAKYLDSTDSSALIVAPQGVAIAESSFYRLTVSGIRDTQTPPNVQKDPRVAEFSSFDTRKPVAKIVSPLADGESLVSELLYTATVSVKDEVTNADSSDVAYVDWLDANGVAIARVKTKPYSYSFVAPSTTTGTTFTLKASAVDLSGNTSPSPDSFTWNVAANLAPRDLVVTNIPTAEYPTHAVQTRVRLKDEGLIVNVALELRGTKTDGTEYRQVVGSTNLSRASTSVEFGEAVFNYTLNETLKDGTATVAVTATDSVNKSAVAEAPLTILADTTKPEIVSFNPKSETHYQFNQTYTIQLQVRDAETGIARAVLSVNGVEVLNTTSGSYDAATGITTFTKSVLVPPKNADTRIAIVATAYDKRNNAVTETHEVIYDRRDDSTLPKAAWITPLDGAALPANQPSWLATLRVRATDDSKVTSVRFESSALASPITIENPKSGTTDIFEAKTTLAIPADKAPFVIKAIVADGDPAHDVELPITIDPVDVAPVITADINISSITADQYANKSVMVRGARVYISVPLTVKDLILTDGALLSNPEETKLDVTITDHLFVDADSRVDVSGRGYLGGFRTREDGSFTNTSLAGRTLGGTTNGGAIGGDGSHAGFGGSGQGQTNATYGSITNPADFGSGSSASTAGPAGGNGGGAVALRGGTGRFVLAGPVLANGDTIATAGAGGSILLDARAIITGPGTRIAANGGDSGATVDFSDTGGGGGRIAIRARERLDLDPAVAVIQARGGRNGGGTEGANYVDGGAGTIHLVRPGATLGELIVSSFDERYPSTSHRAAATPLAGTLSFDAITIGHHALARFDVNGITPTTVESDGDGADTRGCSDDLDRIDDTRGRRRRRAEHRDLRDVPCRERCRHPQRPHDPERAAERRRQLPEMARNAERQQHHDRHPEQRHARHGHAETARHRPRRTRRRDRAALVQHHQQRRAGDSDLRRHAGRAVREPQHLRQRECLRRYLRQLAHAHVIGRHRHVRNVHEADAGDDGALVHRRHSGERDEQQRRHAHPLRARRHAGPRADHRDEDGEDSERHDRSLDRDREAHAVAAIRGRHGRDVHRRSERRRRRSRCQPRHRDVRGDGVRHGPRLRHSLSQSAERPERRRQRAGGEDADDQGHGLRREHGDERRDDLDQAAPRSERAAAVVVVREPRRDVSAGLRSGAARLRRAVIRQQRREQRLLHHRRRAGRDHANARRHEPLRSKVHDPAAERRRHTAQRARDGAQRQRQRVVAPRHDPRRLQRHRHQHAVDRQPARLRLSEPQRHRPLRRPVHAHRRAAPQEPRRPRRRQGHSETSRSRSREHDQRRAALRRLQRHDRRLRPRLRARDVVSGRRRSRRRVERQPHGTRGALHAHRRTRVRQRLRADAGGRRRARVRAGRRRGRRDRAHRRRHERHGRRNRARERHRHVVRRRRRGRIDLDQQPRTVRGERHVRGERRIGELQRRWRRRDHARLRVRLGNAGDDRPRRHGQRKSQRRRRHHAPPRHRHERRLHDRQRLDHALQPHAAAVVRLRHRERRERRDGHPRRSPLGLARAGRTSRARLRAGRQRARHVPRRRRRQPDGVRAELLLRAAHHRRRRIRRLSDVVEERTRRGEAHVRRGAQERRAMAVRQRQRVRELHAVRDRLRLRVVQQERGRHHAHRAAALRHHVRQHRRTADRRSRAGRRRAERLQLAPSARLRQRPHRSESERDPPAYRRRAQRLRRFRRADEHHAREPRRQRGVRAAGRPAARHLSIRQREVRQRRGVDRRSFRDRDRAADPRLILVRRRQRDDSRRQTVPDLDRARTARTGRRRSRGRGRRSRHATRSRRPQREHERPAAAADRPAHDELHRQQQLRRLRHLSHRQLPHRRRRRERAHADHRRRLSLVLAESSA